MPGGGIGFVKAPPGMSSVARGTDTRLSACTGRGRKRVSVVSYNKPSAEHRKERLEGEGCADVEIVETKPSQRPEVGA